MANNPPRTVRIFISSPGDVVEERDRARHVIAGLERLYPDVTLEAVLWEEFALPATASFQESIDFVLKQQPIDVAVFILWSRLGTPLRAVMTRPDGSSYRSGTEREFDLMLAAFEQSGRKRPVILAYARDDDAGFKQRLTECPAADLEELVSQRKLADAFIREQFHDAEGRNVRAYQTYREPIGFVERLRLHLRSVLDDLLGADAEPRWTEEPYRGLEAFDVRHAAIFHGRDEETCGLLQRLRDRQQAGCAFVVIVGASGSGKSSLARAGVAASLVQHAGDDDVMQWRTSVFVPSLGGEDLCAAFVRSLAETIPELNQSATAIEDVSVSLAENAPLTVRLSIGPGFDRADADAGGPVRLLLVLDQMEELWTDRRITSENRNRFFAAIEAIASSGRVAVLATLRSDFYAHAQQMPAFLRVKGERGHYDLLPPDAASLQRLITEPARLAGLNFERHDQTGRPLDEVILEDAARDPSALPLLQYTLSELYQKRDQSRRLLTFAAYNELGGVEGALGKRADEIFQDVPADAQDALDEILPLLVTVDLAGEQAAVRRRATVSELTSTRSRKTLTEHLIAARFLTTDRQENTPIASLAHEALLRRWERIVNWINVNREHLHLRARVEQMQRRWEQQNRDKSLLLPAGLPLEEARQILAEAPVLLSDITQEYIRTSIGNLERISQRTQRNRRIVESVLCILTLVACFGGIQAWRKQREAETERGKAVAAQRNEARERQRAHREALAATASAAEARLNLEIAKRHAHAADMVLAQKNWDRGHIDQFNELINRYRERADLGGFEYGYWSRLAQVELHTLARHTDHVQCVSFSPNGRRLAAASQDKTVGIWNVSTGLEMLTLNGHTAGVNSVSFSLDGARLVSASSDKTVRLWDASSGEETLMLDGHSAVHCACFNHDGTRVASAGNDGTVRVWNAISGDETFTLRGHTDIVRSVAFSPDGSRLASASDDLTVRLWDAASGHELLTLNGHTGDVRCVVFSPDGKRLASAGEDDTVRVWDVITGNNALTLEGHTGWIFSVAFNSDGTKLVSASSDKSVKVWDAATGEQTLTLKGHRGWVVGVSFSPNDQQLASASWDKAVKIWDANADQEALTLKGHTDIVHSVIFSPDGTHVASAGDDNRVRLWDTDSGQEVRAFSGHAGDVTSVAFSPDGTCLASASESGLKVWNTSTGKETLKLKGRVNDVTSVAFSPDGKRIVAASGRSPLRAGMARVWDVATGRETHTFKGQRVGVCNSVTFSPDGTRLALATRPFEQPGEVKLWDMLTGQCVLTIPGFTGDFNSVAFSPDGTRIASSSDYHMVKLWDVATGQEMLALKGHTHAVSCVAFSPDGTRLASAAADGTVKLWDAMTGQETLTLDEHASKVTSVAFSPDGTRLASTSWDKTVKVWDARPWTPQLRAESQARGLLAVLRDRVQSLDELHAKIRSDETISVAVRQQAIDWAELFWRNRRSER